MVQYFTCLFVLLLIADIFQSGICAPVDHGDKQSWINSNKFQGDIANHNKESFDQLVNELADFQTFLANSNNNDSNIDTLDSAISDPRGLWLNGIVPYTFSSTDPQTKIAVMAAIADYHAKTCLKFVERTNQDNYVNIIDSKDGCWSAMGNIRIGAQELNLGDRCKTKGTALHELMHAIGFWHEQQRYDRDDYIIILEDNILPGHDGIDQYVKANNKNMRLIGRYDMDSVMHYPSWGFVKQSGLLSMKAKNSDRTNFGGEELTEEDVRKIRELYNCGDASKLSTSIESGAVYYIKPEGTQNCLDVAPRSSKEFVQLQQWKCNGTPAQKWRITQYGTSPDTYIITNVGNNMYVDVWEIELQSDAGAVGQVAPSNPSHQQIVLKPQPNGKFHMTAVINGRILWVDVKGKLRHWKYDIGQNWSLEKVAP